jgi:short-subunit dehydrogenase
VIRWALITGASHGIGRDVARLAADDFSGLVISGRDADALQALAAELARPGLEIVAVSSDLSTDAGVQALINRTLEVAGIPELVVNNAGFGLWGLSRDLPEGSEEAQVRVNALALTRLTGAFQAAMVARGSGRFLNVASTAAFQPGPRLAAYYATKAYVLHYSEALSYELGGTGVTVTTLCPGPTRSRFHERAGTLRSGLLSGLLPVASSAAVARAGYRGALRGRRLVIPGLLNRLTAASVGFLPRRLVTAFSAFMARPAR